MYRSTIVTKFNWTDVDFYIGKYYIYTVSLSFSHLIHMSNAQTNRHWHTPCKFYSLCLKSYLCTERSEQLFMKLYVAHVLGQCQLLIDSNMGYTFSTKNVSDEHFHL
jgi:hypothetical protein